MNPSSGARPSWGALVSVCLSLLSVTTGIALFGAGDPPTGAPVPPVAVVFVAAGVLFWVVASMEYVDRDPSRI